MTDKLTQADLDAAWLLENMPDATEDDIDYFVERVALLVHMAGNDEEEAREKSLWYLRKVERLKK